MTDGELLDALVLDDSYTCINTISDSVQGRVEVVCRKSDFKVFVRKYIPIELANREVWEEIARLTAQEDSCYTLAHIEQIYELPNYLVIIMEYIEGISVESLVKEGGSIDVKDAVCIMLYVCEALEALASAKPRPIIHRDVTPGNVIVVGLGGIASSRPLRMEHLKRHAVLLDYGIARFAKPGNAVSDSSSYGDADVPAGHDTRVLGTRGFAAPEQFGFAQTDRRSDVYAAGRLLGYMLCAKEPGTQDYETALSEPGVSQEIAAIVRKACAFEPTARFQSAREFAIALYQAARVLGFEDILPTHGSLEDMHKQASVAAVANMIGQVANNSNALLADNAPNTGDISAGSSSHQPGLLPPAAKLKGIWGLIAKRLATPSGMRKRLPLVIRIVLMIAAAIGIFVFLVNLIERVPYVIAGGWGDEPYSLEAWMQGVTGILVYGATIYVFGTILYLNWGINRERPAASTLVYWRRVLLVICVSFALILLTGFIAPNTSR
ncbi:MAG: protein kinase [Coriobacteriales bacterium]|nr:protein kinase [Coriobacteriales bacterium]